MHSIPLKYIKLFEDHESIEKSDDVIQLLQAGLLTGVSVLGVMSHEDLLKVSKPIEPIIIETTLAIQEYKKKKLADRFKSPSPIPSWESTDLINDLKLFRSIREHCTGPVYMLLSKHQDGSIKQWIGNNGTLLAMPGQDLTVFKTYGRLIDEVVYYDGENEQIVQAQIIDPRTTNGVKTLIRIANLHTPTWTQYVYAPETDIT